ncbi:TadE/TadG family type IV pilus assembly protein [Pyxidicoccus xibeiensis]|uniref:TadE/TadG family type IV pilus assembly protein n=1 Tax=Pyxidicoccus xibeiensis TaxID=2906759 RepID=UPI0020A76AF2|nr:TadE family protein [Pyxidicoccus xibeiensis]MCP3139160.1 pilus assembly protein [Pyxidicoccus xibeiensis]
MKRESGQAAVEAALILPLFVFLILGILQLGLMHQARLMTKYAAYKAVRAGSLHNANKNKMERAALAVLLPLISQGSSGAEHIKTVNSATDFQTKWMWPGVVANRMMDTGIPYAEVTICGPLSSELPSGPEVDFDDPSITSSDNWRDSQRTKLRVQLTFNYRMPIPFANMVIFNITRARDVPTVLMMGTVKAAERGKVAGRRFGVGTSDALYTAAAASRTYVMPIRATYTMRMQSNLYPQANPLPSSNQCVFAY